MTMGAAPIMWALAWSIPALLRIAWDLRMARGWSRWKKRNAAPPASAADPAVSLILCVRNDLDALQAIWPRWTGQQFPDQWTVQWVVVDDGSTDGTAAWLRQQAAQDARITVVHHPKQHPGKKEALAAGIAAAAHDRLVLTDADCMPALRWAHTLASTLGHDEQPPHLAFGASLPAGGPVLLQFDALRIAWQSMTEAALGRGYMATGRSLAYRRSTWTRLGGFAAHTDLASGDDDLFVQQAMAAGLALHPVTAGPEARNPTVPARHLREGFRRKRRHLTTAPRYAPATALRLASDAALDPIVALLGLTAPLLLHNGGWIPFVTAASALLVRATTLSAFAKDQGLSAAAGLSAIAWGPVRWAGLALATLLNFTSSPTWTQRAPTRRS